MNLRSANESFRRLYENVNAETVSLTESEVPTLYQLRDKLTTAAFELQNSGNSNIKSFEIAFQDVIENMFPDHSWWEVVNISIFNDLFNERNPFKTIKNICDNVNPGFLEIEEEYDVESIEECLNSLNEEEMSDEDKRDNAIIRGIIDKLHVRRNAALTQEEKDVLAKHNLHTRSWNRDIVDGNNSHVADGTEQGYRYNQGNVLYKSDKPSGEKINYVDRARKNSERKDSRITRHSSYGKKWDMDMANISSNSEKTDRNITFQDAQLIDQEYDMSEPVRMMKIALRSRKNAKDVLATADKEYDDKVSAINAKAQRDIELAAHQRDTSKSRYSKTLDDAQSTISSLLNKKQEEGFEPEVDEQKVFQVTYDSNGVYSAVMVKANSEEDAQNIYNEIKGKRYPKVYGIRELCPVEVDTNNKKGMSTLN